jgi:hypothetical protein
MPNNLMPACVCGVSGAFNSRSIARFGLMGKTVLRRKRGTGLDNVQTNYSIPERCKTTLEEVSARMGMSAPEGLEVILDHLKKELAADGLPKWFNRSRLPEELPMAQAS